jgi:hypothetical protein
MVAFFVTVFTDDAFQTVPRDRWYAPDLQYAAVPTCLYPSHRL